MKKHTYLRAEATYTIPAEFETEVGRIVVRWAYFEDLVQWIVWDLLHLDPPYGRIAAREPRVTDRLTMISELAGLRGIALGAKWKRIETATKALVTSRDQLAHGVWMQGADGFWHVEQTKGAHPKEAYQEKISRRVEPAALKVEITGLKNIAAGIERLIKATQPFYDLVHARQP